MGQVSKKLNYDENVKNSNSSKIQHQQNQQQSNIIFNEHKMKRTIYLNDIKIFFYFKNKKNEKIGFEDHEQEENKKMKNLIQMLKVKNNQVLKIEISNIGCGFHHSYIYDNSFNFKFFFLIFLKFKKKRIIIFIWLQW
jgi:hypothetical protein